MEVKLVKIAEIKPYDRNPRNNDGAVDAVAASIKEFGWRQPIVVDRDGVIIAGHTRYKAAQKLKCKEVPVVVAENLTDEQVKAYRLADNKTGELAEWDTALLDEELTELADFDMSQFGFDTILQEEARESEEDDYEVELPEEPKAKPGDIYQLGRHRLMCGDCTIGENIDKLLDGKTARITITSPPYGVGKDYEEKGIETWKKTISGVINAIKGKTILIVWNIADLFSTGTQYSEPTGAYSVEMMEQAGYKMLYNRIWKKPGGVFSNNPYYTVTTKPVQDYEYLYCFAEKDAEKRLDEIKAYLFTEAKKAKLNDKIIKELGGPGAMCGHWFTNHQWAFINSKNYKKIFNYCKKNKIPAFEKEYDELENEYKRKIIFSHCLSKEDFSSWGMYGVWEFNTVHKRLGGHAAAFPIELPSRFIKMHTYRDDLILDPFGGTGTTLIAAEELGRNCATMEREPKYVDVIIDRWENLTGEKAVKIDGAE